MCKRIRLSDSEKQNADKSYGGHLYTIINRPGKCGSRLVSAVYLDGTIIQSKLAQSKDGVKDVVVDILRMMDKCAQGGQMAKASRCRLQKCIKPLGNV